MGRTQCCSECDGLGRTKDWDDDRYIVIRCPICEGLGELADCRRCLEPTSPIELEMLSGICRSCAIDLETMAVEDEHAGLRRSA